VRACCFISEQLAVFYAFARGAVLKPVCFVAAGYVHHRRKQPGAGKEGQDEKKVGY
jgi:hypothetical protein